jgi:two-component system sensor histidine kinase QseC
MSTAEGLIDSKAMTLRTVDFKQIDALLTADLGERRVDKFFIISDDQWNVLFMDSDARALKLGPIPTSPRWLTLKHHNHHIRVLNLELPKIPNRRLQVGLVYDDTIFHLTFLNRDLVFYYLISIAGGIVTALILTPVLLRPISNLSTYVKDASASVVRTGELQPLPTSILKFTSGKEFDRDEFADLVRKFSSLVESLNRSHRLTRLWAYQMAHELKTPLTLLKVEVEKLVQQPEAWPYRAEAMKAELSKVSETVNSFLGWAEIENTSQKRTLHAIRMSKKVAEVLERFQSSHPNRLNAKIVHDFYIAANAVHFEQILSNLVSNALQYSPPDSKVDVEVRESQIVVRDRGPGIPQEVLTRLGEPFNRGANSHREMGHGLGLAWISSVAKLYDWNLRYESGAHGTTVTLEFGGSQRGREFRESELTV